MTVQQDRSLETSTGLRWDDRYAQYLIAMGHLCASAELARLRVEAITAHGDRISGLVAPTRAERRDHLADTGFPRTLQIGDALVALDDVVQLTIHPPPPDGSSPGR